jgi:hypothetical protein
MSTDNRSLMEKLKDEAVPSLLAGGIGVIASNQLMGVDLGSSVNILNLNMPIWVAIGGTIAGANALSYALHDQILERIPSIQSFANYENKLLAPVTAGLGTYGVFRLGVSSETSLMNSFLLGGGSSITAKYAYDMYNQNKQ